MAARDAGSVAAAERLLGAARNVVLTHGLADSSVRLIASAAGVAPSAINYNFGSLERLFVALFGAERGATSSWARQVRADFSDLPPGAVGAVAGLLHAVRSWTSDPARALLYAEARARPGVEHVLGPELARRMRGVFEGLAHAVALPPPASALMHAFFEMQALLHLSRWRPALDEAALAELAERFVGIWLVGDPAPRPCAAYNRAVRIGAQASAELPPAAMRFAEVAVSVVGALGLHGLTHRAVASACHVSAGAVAHYFRSWEDLLAGALRGQVELLLREDAIGEPPSRAAFIEHYAARAQEPTPPAPIRARNELFLAALRRPEFASAGATIRYAHGGTTLRLLGPRLMERDDATVASSVTSLLFAGLWRSCVAAPDPTRERADLATFIAARVASLG